MENIASLSRSVIAIVVSYNPDFNGFKKLIEAILPQVTFTIVIDNASTNDLSTLFDKLSCKNLEIIKMPENLGIAAAQNAGIERAVKLGADYVLLSDQDSVPSCSMVAELLSVAKTDDSSRPIAAIGPAIIDRRTGLASFFIVERLGFPCKWLPSTSYTERFPSYIEVGFLISSGTLIPVNVFEQIGAMRSNYFIDHVDTEWCFRAKAMGYRLLGVPKARLTHQLGDAVKRVWFLGHRQVMYHSPLRDYYMFRNTLLMLRDSSMSLIWQFHFLWRLVQFAGYFLTFSFDRWMRFKMMGLGILHGFLKISGRLDEKSNWCSVMPISSLEPASKLKDGMPHC